MDEDDFNYNGIDRKDSNLGYTNENCVPCCKVCNNGKRDLPYSEWLEYLETLISFQEKHDK